MCMNCVPNLIQKSGALRSRHGSVIGIGEEQANVIFGAELPGSMKQPAFGMDESIPEKGIFPHAKNLLL